MKLLTTMLLLIYLIFTPGCVTLQEPVVEYQNIEVKNLDLEKITLDFHIKVTNPNPVNIDNAEYSYVLEINNETFAFGEKITLKIPADDSTITIIPMVIPYDKLFKSTQDLAQAILSEKKSIPFRLSGKMTFSALSLSLDIPFDSSGDIPLPKLSDLSF